MPETPPSPRPSHPATPPAAASPSVGQRVARYRVLWVLALVTLTLDQLTKLWIASILPFNTYGESSGAITVIRGFFHLVHVGNTGAAWSMFSGRSVLLATLAASTLIAIFYWRRALGLREGLSQVSFGLLCGGIAGNLVDRLLHHHVIDFIDLHFGSYTYPTFNVADCGICIGVILYLWQSLRSPEGVRGDRHQVTSTK